MSEGKFMRWGIACPGALPAGPCAKPPTPQSNGQVVSRQQLLAQVLLGPAGARGGQEEEEEEE